MKRISCKSFVLAPAPAHSPVATVRRLLLGTAALVAAMVVLMPEDASAQWRGGWRGPGWGYGIAGWGGYRPWAGPIVYAAPVIALAPYVAIPPVSYSYAAPSYGGGYYGGGYPGVGYYGGGYPGVGYYGVGYYGGGYYGGGYYGYRRCVTDEGYGRYRGCDR